MWELVLVNSSGGKLQICLSFKHTPEEERLYEYVIGQSDKSVFLKNLIRESMGKPIHDKEKHYTSNDDVNDYDVKADDNVKDKPVTINHGKETRSKYLA